MLYFCYDTALNKEYTLFQLKKQYPDHRCLFEGTKDGKLWDVAPWLFAIGNDIPALYAHFRSDPLASLKRATLFESGLGPEALVAHLQDFIYYTEAGKAYFFRFWDAAVMEKYLGSCTAAQLDVIYSKALQAIYCAPDEQNIRQYRYQSGKLHSTNSTTVAAVTEPGPPGQEAATTETATRKPRKFFID